ncbi:MAG: AAA family ATPase [Nannocystaceae bacterium]
MLLDISSLSSSSLEELLVLLLRAEGYERSSSLMSAWGEHDFDEWTTQGAVRWIVETKGGLDPARLNDQALRLAGARQLVAADRALLITTATVSNAKLRKVLDDLGVDLWDGPILDELISQHPSAIGAFEAERARRVAARRAGQLVLHRLSLRNFRGIESLELDLRRGGSVLVLHGPNGAGKSAILTALSGLLSRLVQHVGNPKGKARTFSTTDLRNGTQDGAASLTADVEGHEITWVVALGRGRSSISELSDAATTIRAALESTPGTSIPLAVYYPVNRAVVDIPQRIRGKREFPQLAAYEGALVAGNRDFRRFFEWFRLHEDLENERRIGDTDHRDPQLEAVRTAVAQLLPSVSNLRIQRRPLRMTVDKGERELMVDQLSDGEKCLLAMVGDLARRLAIANPSRGNPLQCCAVVLIDEIELHLHPGWQREVIPRLQATFPGIQFVVTTHSAAVLGRLDRGSVVKIEDGRAYTDGPHTRGRDASSIMSDAMGIARHPPEVERELAEIADLIDDERLDAAREAIDVLAADRGDSDGEVVRLRTMVDFLDA